MKVKHLIEYLKELDQEIEIVKFDNAYDHGATIPCMSRILTFKQNNGYYVPEFKSHTFGGNDNTDYDELYHLKMMKLIKKLKKLNIY